MTTTSVFSVVVGDNDADRLNAYLYAHTECIASATFGSRTAYLLRTRSSVEASDTVVAHERALYLARYQCERLSSGLYGVNTVGGTSTAAGNAITHFLSHELTSFELATRAR